MNEHYIKNISEKELYERLEEYCLIYKEKIETNKKDKLKNSLSFLKNKAKTLEDVYNNSKYILSNDVIFNKNDLELIDEKAKKIIIDFRTEISNQEKLSKPILEPIINNLIKKYETNFKGVGQPLRIALTGSKFGPGIYDIILSLNKIDIEMRLVKVIK
tara:strand:- start:216 stop:692 length:477 start_codon:yes stop_codon:yes gene_type:complete